MTTVDMVGAPNGKITGQTWSQVLISNICDMVVTVVNSKKGGQEGDELVEEGHIQILNSVDACTGQGKYHLISDMTVNPIDHMYECKTCKIENKKSQRG